MRAGAGVAVTASRRGATLFERVQAVGRDFARSLDVTSPTFGALRSGSIDREVYAALLVQIVKAEALVNSLFHRLPEALSLTSYELTPGDAERSAHPEELALSDLSSIWHCSEKEAFARAFSEPPLPPVQLFAGTIDTLLVHYPWALPSAAIVLDEWADAARPASAELERRQPWPEAKDSILYLAAPNVRAEHLRARELFDCVRQADDRAVLSAAQSTADMLRFLFAHLDESV